MFTRVALSAALAILLSVPNFSSAAQFQSGGNVVHTRLAPVVMHRVFPPYWGVHRYQRAGGMRRGR
jgi:hypothetical protein